jgi:hypothetical protein
MLAHLAMFCKEFLRLLVHVRSSIQHVFHIPASFFELKMVLQVFPDGPEMFGDLVAASRLDGIL